MIRRTFAALSLAGLLVAAASEAPAQSAQPPLQDRWPAPAQQMEQRGAPEAPAQAAPAAPEPAPAPAAPAPAAAPASAPAAAPRAAPPATKRAQNPERKAARTAAKPTPAPPTTVACTGVFSRESSHQALESAFNVKNVTFAEVEGGPEGSKLMASVLFPADPKRRLEVLWENEDERTEVHRIVITGQSAWTGPKGLRLGMPLDAVEKINGKPFKLRGFDPSNSSVAIDWQDGALASLPGGCNVGLFFAADPTAPQSARAEATAAEFLSSDEVIRTLKPTVTEILFGYH